MAIAFKTAKASPVSATRTSIYTCPPAKTAVILSIIAANINGTVSADLDIDWTDSSDGNDSTYIVKTVPVPADSSLDILRGSKLVLEAGDVLYAKGSISGHLDLTVGIMER